ncbi:MAG TPA: protein translocase subunit SecF [Candidatus Dormibacteraeota bacterium]|nr:protein translocase subunit SecF [Candidatus Dormibacteraeota bacterium]
MAELSRPDSPGVDTVRARDEISRVRRFDFVGHRNIFFLISLLIIVPGIICMITRGFLLGVDFAGGTEFDLSFSSHPTQAQVAVTAQSLYGESTVQRTTDGSFVIVTPFLSIPQQTAVEHALSHQFGTISDLSVTVIGPAIAQETVNSAFLAVVIAACLILLYLAFRFRKVPGGWRSGFQFGGSALLALLHDVFLLAGVFSILGRWFNLHLGEIDTMFLTAILTVVGFSVHDTIVVFDRIRENLGISRRLTFEQVANLSIMQTLARSIITSFTVVLVLLALFLFGGESIKGFVLALLIGIVSGTYSSIFNATPLLCVWRRLQPVR